MTVHSILVSTTVKSPCPCRHWRPGTAPEPSPKRRHWCSPRLPDFASLSMARCVIIARKAKLHKDCKTVRSSIDRGPMRCGTNDREATLSAPLFLAFPRLRGKVARSAGRGSAGRMSMRCFTASYTLTAGLIGGSHGPLPALRATFPRRRGKAKKAICDRPATRREPRWL